jgi:hypothetical protein
VDGVECPRLVSMGVLLESTVHHRAVKALHRELVLEVMQLFSILVGFPAVDDLHQPLCDGREGVLLPERHERPWATTVFGWTGMLSADAHKIVSMRRRRQERFDAKLMLPEVAKVLLIEEALAGS